MKDETADVSIEEFARLKSIRCIRSEHKKAKGLNKMLLQRYVRTNIDVLQNNKCLRYSVNRIQSKNHRIGTYDEIKISLSYFNDKIYIQSNVYCRFAVGYQNQL